MIKHVKDLIQGKAKAKEYRSSKWDRVRRNHLIKNPTCAVCGGSKKLEVHHVKPFNSYPELELNPDNLITLCESRNKGVNCHLLFGHLGNYKKINPKVIEDAKMWNSKIINK